MKPHPKPKAWASVFVCLGLLPLAQASSDVSSWAMVEKIRNALKVGTNVVAIHCHNEHHPQYIDLGMVDVIPNNENHVMKER